MRNLNKLKIEISNHFAIPSKIEVRQFFDNRELEILETGFLDETPNKELDAEIDAWRLEVESRGNEPHPLIVSAAIKWDKEQATRWQYTGKVDGKDHWERRCNQ